MACALQKCQGQKRLRRSKELFRIKGLEGPPLNAMHGLGVAAKDIRGTAVQTLISTVDEIMVLSQPCLFLLLNHCTVTEKDLVFRKHTEIYKGKGSSCLHLTLRWFREKCVGKWGTQVRKGSEFSVL